MNKNVLVFAYNEMNPRTGGIGRVAATLKENLARLGYNLLFCSINKEKNLESIDNPLKHIYLPDSSLIDSENNLSFLLEYIRVNYVKIILCKSSDNNRIANLFSMIRNSGINVKIVCALHTTPDFLIKEITDISSPLFKSEQRISRQYRRIMRKLLLNIKVKQRRRRLGEMYQKFYSVCDTFVLLSDKYVDIFKEISQINNTDKIKIIYNPIDLEHIVCNNKEKRILYVGRLGIEKRVDRLIMIWRKLYKKFPDWSLDIVGSGKCYEEMLLLIRKYGLDRIYLYGYDNPEKYYEKASAILLTSSFEGFGMTLIEGMMYGLIPFSFNSYDAVYDIIKDTYNGFIIPKYNLDAYVERLSLIMNNEDLRTKMGSVNIEYVHRFGANEISQKWKDLFDSIIYS